MNDHYNYKLYGEFGDRYDLHTPPHHYAHDHNFVLERVRAFGGTGRFLDIGCGTGVLLEKALILGLDPVGIDLAPVMVAKARERVGETRVHCLPMQELTCAKEFDCIVSLSWSLNYCRDLTEMAEVLKRCQRALRPGGGLIIQVAHAANAPKNTPEFNVDREPGPGGADDIHLRYRFWTNAPLTMMAEYQFECVSSGEKFMETHLLNVADAKVIVSCLKKLNFDQIEVLDNFHGQEFRYGISPIIIARTNP